MALDHNTTRITPRFLRSIAVFVLVGSAKFLLAPSSFAADPIKPGAAAHSPVIVDLSKGVAPVSAGSDPSVEVSYGIPYGGALDAFHKAPPKWPAASPQDPTGDKANLAVAMYAFRNVLVADALEVRKDLKDLIGPGIYDVPQGIEAIYRGWSRDRIAGQSTPMPDIVRSIEWLKGPGFSADEGARDRVLKYLVLRSIDLIRYDQQIKFYEEDYWKDPTVERQFEQQAGPRVDPGLLESGGLQMALDAVRSDWMKDHGMTERLAALAGLRNMLAEETVSHASTLVVRIQKSEEELGKKLSNRWKGTQPLYALLYDRLAEAGIMPSRTQPQRPTTTLLPGGGEPIPQPREFEERALAATNVWLAGGLETLKSRRADVYKGLIRDIRAALIAQVEQNDNLLSALGEHIGFTGEDDDPLMQLAALDVGSHHQLVWRRTVEAYGYLNRLGMRVNFARAMADIQAAIKRMNRKNTVERAAYQGLAVIAAGASAFFLGPEAGPPAAEGVVAAEAATEGASEMGWFTQLKQGMDLSKAAKTVSLASLANYWRLRYATDDDIRKFEEMLYYGTGSSGDVGSVQGAAARANADWWASAATMAWLGLSVSTTETFVSALRMAANSEAAVSATGAVLDYEGSFKLLDKSYSFPTLREGLEALLPRLKTLGLAGQIQFARLIRLLKIDKIAESALPLEEVLARIAKDEKIPLAEVVELMKAEDPVLCDLIDSKTRVMVDELIVRAQWQGFISAAMETYGELGTYDSIDRNPTRLTLNVVGSAAVSYFIALATSGRMSFLRERAQVSLWGFVSFAGADFIYEAGRAAASRDLDRLKQKAPEMGIRGLYGIAFGNTTTWLRFTAYNRLFEEQIERFTQDKAAGQVYLKVVSLANNASGGWQYAYFSPYVMDIVDAADQKLGVQNPDIKTSASEDTSAWAAKIAKLPGVYFRHAEPPRVPGGHLFSALANEDGLEALPMLADRPSALSQASDSAERVVSYGGSSGH